MIEETKRKIGEKNKINSLGNSNAKGHKYSMSEENKNKISIRMSGNKHALGSGGSNYWEGRKGEFAANWKGGHNRQSFRIGRASRAEFNREIKEVILKRDNYECQICDSKENLQVDHIQSWAEYVELRFSVDNCRTLCMNCHYKITNGKDLDKDKVWGHNYKDIERMVA